MKSLIIISNTEVVKDKALNPTFVKKCTKKDTLVALIGEVKAPEYDKEANEEKIDMTGIEDLHNMSFLVQENVDEELGIVVDAFPYFKADSYNNFPNPGFLIMVMNTHQIDPKQITIMTENPENPDYKRIKDDYPNVVIEKI